MNKCVRCVFYKLTSNLSYCGKFNTFTEFALKKCGPELKYFLKKKSMNISPYKMNISPYKMNISPYNKYSTNF